MKKLAFIVTLWIVVTSIWWAASVLVFIVPTYESMARESGGPVSAGLQAAIDLSRTLRGSWHWIALSAVLISGTVFSLGYTVKTGRRAQAVA